MPAPDEPRRSPWAPIEPTEGDGAPPQAPPPPPPGADGGWGPPQGPAGWSPPPSGPPGWGPPPPAWGAPNAGFGPPIGLLKAGDARTGPLPMHPMGVGDVLDGAFKLLKANARTIVLVVAAIVVPVQLVASFAVRRQVGVGLINIINDPTLAQSQQDVGLGNAAVSIVTGLVSLLTAPLIAGAVSRVVATSYLGGELGPAEALRITVRRFWPLLGASFLVGLAHVAGVLLCVLPILVPFTLYTATTPALMIEEVGAVEAMRRSWRLLRPRFWAVCGVLLLARLIAGFLGNILGTVPSTVAVFTGGSLAWFFIALGGVVSSIVSAPIAAIVSTLLYFDARIRHEGFDLQVMANDLERGAAR